MTLPSPLRNRLAGLILEALHDSDARLTLARVATGRDGMVDGDGARQDRDEPGVPATERARCDAELRERARRAWRALDGRALDPREPSVSVILASAAVLFDAGLYFETHELLEPCWQRAEGAARLGLQGLIQIAVGFEHLASGNAPGARALLDAGSAKTGAGRVEGMDLRAFTRGVRACLGDLADRGGGGEFDWTTVPRFPGLDAGAQTGEG